MPVSHPPPCARSSMDRALPSEGKGYWFEPSRAHHGAGPYAFVYCEG